MLSYHQIIFVVVKQIALSELHVLHDDKNISMFQEKYLILSYDITCEFTPRGNQEF